MEGHDDYVRAHTHTHTHTHTPSAFFCGHNCPACHSRADLRQAAALLQAVGQDLRRGEQKLVLEGQGVLTLLQQQQLLLQAVPWHLPARSTEVQRQNVQVAELPKLGLQNETRLPRKPAQCAWQAPMSMNVLHRHEGAEDARLQRSGVREQSE